MAVFAFLAQAALMYVIGAMASDTRATHFFLVQWRFVAAFALCGTMFAEQRIVSVFVVVEMDVFPITLGMTGLALLAEAPFVRVVFTVAANTGFWRLGVTGVLMAIRAFGIGMLTEQWKFSLGVVEGGVFPVFFVMASFAFRAKRAFMDVVFFVAGITFVRRFAVFDAGFMAVRARDLRCFMRAF